eukprot:gene5308-18553_t
MKKTLKKSVNKRQHRPPQHTKTTCDLCGATLNIPPSDEYNLQQHQQSDSCLKEVVPEVPVAVETSKTTCNLCGTLLLIPPSDLLNLRQHQESTSCIKKLVPIAAEPTTTCNLCGTLLQIPTSDVYNLIGHKASQACRDARPRGRSISDFFFRNDGPAPSPLPENAATPILSQEVVLVSPSNSSEGPSSALPRLRSGALPSPQPSRQRASLSLGSTEAQPSRAKGFSLCKGFLPPEKPAVPLCFNSLLLSMGVLPSLKTSSSQRLA